jgi:hypothetical protein
MNHDQSLAKTRAFYWAFINLKVRPTFGNVAAGPDIDFGRLPAPYYMELAMHYPTGKKIEEVTGSTPFR